MGQNTQPERARRALISVDWMLLTVAAIIMLFCVGAFIRIASEPHTARHQGGLLSLTASDALLAFEDFNFGAAGWSPEATSNRVNGLGPVLGPFSDDVVVRAFQLPVDTEAVRVSFDVHLHGIWGHGDAMAIAFGDMAATLTFGEIVGNQLPVHVSGSDDANLDIRMSQAIIAPRAVEPALPGTSEDAIFSLQLAFQLIAPPEIFSLVLEAENSDTGTWTLDNLAVVATTDGAA